MTTSPDAGTKLEEALKRWDAMAMQYQRSRQPMVVVAVAVGPVAVVLLAMQTFVFRQGPAATALVGLELAALAVALLYGLLKIGSHTHDRWITTRIRAEILRRERFLYLARVGPYLNQSPAEAADIVTRRVVEIESEISSPLDLLALRDGDRRWWDTLEQSSGLTLAPIEGLAPLVESYLTHRVADQRQFFVARTRKQRNHSEFLENAARVTLALALIVAAIHFGQLLSGHASEGVVHGVMLIAAFALPAVGSAFAAMQSAAGSLRLSRSYEYYARTLVPFEKSLAEFAQALKRGERDLGDDRRFRRLVLSVEQTLSDELREWWMTMGSREPKAGP